MKDASIVPTKYWREVPPGRVQCDVCPRECRLREGQRGFCFVRQNLGGEVKLTTYGRSSGFCVDPIEKKPLRHFLPGTPVFSFGTAGCNLGCKYCQNWRISDSRHMESVADEAPPEAIARAAGAYDCPSVAFTYNDPIVFLEYAVDTARACHERGIRSVAVSNGYISGGGPREELFAHVDAANIDLKGFSERFYRKLAFGHLAPVLDTLRYVRHETDVWLEVTTLLIPGWNDSTAELRAQCAWFADELGPDVPLHFSAFHPEFKLFDVPQTPPATLERALYIAREAGLRYVYIGNVAGRLGQDTRCHSCDALLIERKGYELGRWGLEGGRCGACGTPCAGVFEDRPGDWGSRRRMVGLERRL